MEPDGPEPESAVESDGDLSFGSTGGANNEAIEPKLLPGATPASVPVPVPVPGSSSPLKPERWNARSLCGRRDVVVPTSRCV